MATGGGEDIRSSITELQNTRQSKFTDCPNCGVLILGPCLLECGHVLCRKCLREVLQNSARPRCPECDLFLRSLPQDKDLSVTQLIHKACQEPVLQCLVEEELEKREDIRCLKCTQTKAVKVCLDCQDYMCEECSQTHLSSQDGKDHVLQTLPHASLEQASSESEPAPSSCQAGSSTTKDASRDQPPRDDVSREEQKEFVSRQLEMLRAAYNEKDEQSKALQGILGVAQRLLAEELARGQRLRNYQQAMIQLSSLNLDEIDPATHTVEFEGSQVTVEELKRLGDDIQQSPNADILMSLSRMMFGEDKN